MLLSSGVRPSGSTMAATPRFCPAPAILISGSVAMTAKETARAVLDRLPEDCSLDDVLYHLYVAQTVQQGRADDDAGLTIPHDEVEAELRRKWLLGGDA